MTLVCLIMQNKIIHFLKTNTDYLSGEEISRHLKISRAGIWKYIQELRRKGYAIDAVPHLGYRLVSCPDKLLPIEIQSGLRAKILGHDVRYFDSVDSTMDVAFQLGVEGASEGTVVCAESQAKGKGRLGRGWTSPKSKGIYMSVILRPSLAPTDVARFTLLSAVAVCEAVARFSGVTVKIKWPNDILVGDKKLAGILTEMSAEMDRVRFIVIGIGINVSTPLSQLPPNATSIKKEMKKKVSRVVLFQDILWSLENWYSCSRTQGFVPVIKRWKELSSTLGQHIRLVDQSGDIEGQAVDLDEYGGLMIRGHDGLIVKKMSGDVIPVG